MEWGLPASLHRVNAASSNVMKGLDGIFYSMDAAVEHLPLDFSAAEVRHSPRSTASELAVSVNSATLHMRMTWRHHACPVWTGLRCPVCGGLHRPHGRLHWRHIHQGSGVHERHAAASGRGQVRCVPLLLMARALAVSLRKVGFFCLTCICFCAAANCR